MNTKRVFVVGCPRSGTTLLQSMVASHSQVVSFPETHFFSATLPINSLLRRIRLYGPSSRAVISNFLEANGYSDIRPFVETGYFSTHNRWCKILLQTLDEMILRKAKNNASQQLAWGLEKTPRHLFYISSIQQSGFQSKFLHLLRSGPDVVASLYLATQNYPEQWGGTRSIKKCIHWWNNSIKESIKYQGKKNHFFATYGQLLHEPEKVLKAMSNFLDLEFETTMTKDFHNTSGSLIKEEEEWKEKNAQRSLTKSNKLEQHFDSSTIAYIRRHTHNIDLAQFYH